LLRYAHNSRFSASLGLRVAILELPLRPHRRLIAGTLSGIVGTGSSIMLMRCWFINTGETGGAIMAIAP